jgi:hypothetical protein
MQAPLLGAQLRAYEISLRTIIRECLIVVGGIGISRGVVYAISDDSSIPFGVEFVSQGIPLIAWALLWVAAGLASLICAVRPDPRGTAGVVGVSLAWAAGYLASFLFAAFGTHYGQTLDILGSIIYLALALLLIRGRTLAESCLELIALVRSLIDIPNGPGDGDP